MPQAATPAKYLRHLGMYQIYAHVLPQHLMMEYMLSVKTAHNYAQLAQIKHIA